MRPGIFAWLLTAAATTAGCASTPEVRNLSDQTGLYVTSLRDGTAEFVAAQNRLNAENERHLQNLAASASAARTQVARQRLAWTSGGQTEALDTQALASSVSAADVVARLKPRSVQPVTVSFAGGKGYGDAAEALTEVSTKPSTVAVLIGLAEFAYGIGSSFEALGEEANSETAGTAQTTAAADAQADRSANEVPTNPNPNP